MLGNPPANPPPEPGKSADDTTPPAETPQAPPPLSQIPAHLAPLLAAQHNSLPYLGGPSMMPPFLPPGIPLPRGMQVQIQAQFWQGQFPPPDVIEKYEKITPGSFDRIIQMAEKLQSAQIEETKRAQDYTQKDAARGQRLGFWSIIAAVIGATICALYGSYTHTSGAFAVAGAMIGLPLMGAVKALIDSAKTPSAKDFVASIDSPSAPVPRSKLSPSAPPAPSSSEN